MMRIRSARTADSTNIAAAEPRWRDQTGIGQKVDGMALIVIEHDGGSRFTFDQIADDAVVAGISELHHAFLAIDGESDVLDRLGDEAEMGRSGHETNPTDGV
jgi:hypothetical protein